MDKEIQREFRRIVSTFVARYPESSRHSRFDCVTDWSKEPPPASKTKVAPSS